MRFWQACCASLFTVSTSAAQTTLVAHYKLDETSGTVAADSSGLGNDGTYTGGVTLGQPGTCPASTAVDFDGIDGHVAIPSSPALDSLSSDFTVAAWVSLDVSQLQRVLSNERLGSGGGGSWSLGPNSGNLRFTTLGVQDYNQASAVVTAVWHHIAIVFDANFQAHFYLDGVLQGTVSGSSPANSPNPRWFIGVLDLIGPNPEWLDGQIDDVQVYSGSATGTEILSLFRNPCSTLGSGVGTGYCASNPNSTGSAAQISAEGSESVAAADLTLISGPVPNQPSVFLYAPLQVQVPFGHGFLCVTGGVALLPVVVATGQEAVHVVDFGALPAVGQIIAGQTWNFQHWYRDPAAGGAAFNTSNGLEITFTP